MDFTLERKRYISTAARGRRAADVVANMPRRKIPLGSFFPSLGSKHGVIFMGFLKHCPDQEMIVSIDEEYLRFHEFYPFYRTGEMCGPERSKLAHELLPSAASGGLLVSNVTVLIANSVVASVVMHPYIDSSTIRIFSNYQLLYLDTHPASTADHSLYRLDYLDPAAPFAFVYRSSRTTVEVVCSLCSLDTYNDSTKEEMDAHPNWPGDDVWKSEGESWFKSWSVLGGGEKSGGGGGGCVNRSKFDALGFAKRYVAVKHTLYSVCGPVLAAIGPPDATLRQLIILIYIPLQSTIAEKSIQNIILFLSLQIFSGDIVVLHALDAEEILSGTQRMEFAGYCSTRGLKKAYPCAIHYCRDKLCEDDEVFVAKESFCSVLSNFSTGGHKSTNSESWLLEIEHPILPLVIYNDEVL
jgi:hypothetical protein